MSRLSINEKKLRTLSDGMKQIAENTNILGKVLKCTKLTDDLILQQVTVPIGVLLVIFESRPDSLPQVIINLIYLMNKNVINYNLLFIRLHHYVLVQEMVYY